MEQKNLSKKEELKASLETYTGHWYNMEKLLFIPMQLSALKKYSIVKACV